MACLFSVIRFVPSSITNEAINIGVLFASADRIEVRTLDDWHRVKAFDSQRWKDVRRLADDLEDDPRAFLGVNPGASAEGLRNELSKWTRVLQFSDVRASLAPMAELLETMPAMLLGEGADALSPGGRRNVVVRALYQAVVSAYELRFDRRPRGVIQKQATIAGKKTSHKIDVGIANGTFYGGAFALSFATGQTEKQWKDTDAVAFAVDDMMGPREKIAVVLDAPTQASEPYDRAQDLFKRLHVPVLGFDEISAWANRALIDVPEHAAH